MTTVGPKFVNPPVSQSLRNQFCRQSVSQKYGPGNGTVNPRKNECPGATEMVPDIAGLLLCTTRVLPTVIAW